MCTAITYKNSDNYFGRNLDYEHNFGEQIIITPRKYPITFKQHSVLTDHYAIIGMAVEADNYPLYFDAVNEFGLSIAGLNFPDNAKYFDNTANHIAIAPYELPLWLLGQFKTIDECLHQLKKCCLISIPFNKSYPLSPLHWLVADKEQSIVIESMETGLHIYSNSVGVLTNNPPFEFHMHNLSNYLNVTAMEPENRFAPSAQIAAYSRGMGGIGLPGDNSSSSRFIRAAFTKLNSVSAPNEESNVAQFFHILNSVCQVNGCTHVGCEYEKTIYSSCCNIDKGIYYYNTYENCQINAVKMNNYDLNSSALCEIPLNRTLQINNAL